MIPSAIKLTEPEDEIAAALQQLANPNDAVNSLARVVPEVALTEIREYIDHSEVGIGFEFLCNRIYKSGSPSPRSTLMRLGSIGRSMGVDGKNWRTLRIG